MRKARLSKGRLVAVWTRAVLTTDIAVGGCGNVWWWESEDGSEGGYLRDGQKGVEREYVSAAGKGKTLKIPKTIGAVIWSVFSSENRAMCLFYGATACYDCTTVLQDTRWRLEDNNLRTCTASRSFCS